MQIIKLDATDSTNAYLKSLVVENPLEDFTVVIANQQLKGRGQMGTSWESEAGKNLTFSVLKKFDQLQTNDQIVLNIATSLAVYEALNKFHVPDLAVKWPNDILSGTSKICGILIENMLKGSSIKASIIGIGLNVNQLLFNNLTQVSSLRLLLGRTIDLDELLQTILDHMQSYFSMIRTKSANTLKEEYEKVLFRKDKPSTFKNSEGELFMGFIRGISDEGKLLVAIENEKLKQFGLKEIQLMY